MKNRFLFVALFAMLIAACNPVEVGVETPTPVAPAATPTAAPPPTPTSVPLPTQAPTEPGGVFGFACSLAYASESRVYCPGEGGTPVMVAEDTRGTISAVAVSSDGAWVAYIVNLPPENATSELWAVKPGGDAAPIRLVRPEQLVSPRPDTTSSPRNIAWLAGTHTLIFDTRFVPSGGIQGPGEYIHNDLWRVEAETGALRNLLPAQAGGNFHLSPDGQRIAISGATSIQLLNVDGSNLRTVIEYPMIITYSEYQYKPAVVWSTDSAFFTVFVPSPDPMAADSSATIFRVAAAGDSGETMGRFDGNFVFGGPLGPGLSPDGRRLVYGRSTEQGVSNLVLVGVDGSDPTIFDSTSLSANGWGWSPDSEWYGYGIVPDGSNVLLRRNGALQEFGAGLTLVGLEWVDATSFYFSAVSGEANYGLYFQRVGEATQPLVNGLQPGLTFDAR
jgi:hypothetical protein